ncbi:hypothetical protein IM792_09155 [Mucilaginibacter sp. JRF]|uniref:hypothetical protein n=1 Tax=Mucilaginibacter sp. JRF TaxID=2780088 RepID=UPI0018808222|nr:hypothetical protein [Mucilaginibacter sp. JRF]MBE9584611.1 hypothetical protein [Mucilaginibacter sp. JRF]
MGVNTDKFFASIRKNLFNGALKQSQVDGLNAILSATSEAGIIDTRYIAYMLATVFHETARTMQPIEEYSKGRAMIMAKS